MDQKVSDDFDAPLVSLDDEFLLREGLDVLANYRAIRPDSVRFAVRILIATLVQVNVDVDQSGPSSRRYSASGAP